MSISFSVLASGSQGNCTVVRLRDCDSHDRSGTTNGRLRKRDRYLLIDAGISVRQTRLRLERIGLCLSDVSDVLITHPDHDHLSHSWLRHLDKLPVRMHIHRCHRHRIARTGARFSRIDLFEDELQCHDSRIETVMFSHDSLGTVGYVIEHNGRRFGLATDLGKVPDSMFGCFCDLDALALESNYDRQMQVESDRPGFLKSRIMNGRGHLSNDQSLQAVLRIASTSPLQHVVLLHLSRQCNTPDTVRGLYARKAPNLLSKLTIADQFRPTPWLEVKPQSQRRPLMAAPVVEQQLVLF